MAVAWWIAGLIMFISIVGIPWGRSCFVIGLLCLWPFGKEVVSRRDISGKDDIGTGFLGLLGNIIWFIFGGIWMGIGHISLMLAYFISIIGIPFGIQHFKLAKLSLAPIGKTVITK